MAEQVKINVSDIVDKAMINLIINFPIFANMITRIGYKVIKGYPKACACTDGRCIYISQDAIEDCNLNPIDVDIHGNTINKTITQREMQFLLCHELMHILNFTWEREKKIGVDPNDMSELAKQKRKLWNIATDYEINSLLHNNEETQESGEKIRKPVGNMPEFGCYESEYRDMTAEEIYVDLIKKMENGQLNINFGGSGNGEDGEGNGEPMQLDIHMPVEDQDVKNEIISKMSEVYGSRQNGTGESAIDRSLERTFKPQPFNWRKALSKYMRKFVKENYTWNKPSRTGIANHLILPSQGQGAMLNIGVAIDTSGSITEKEINAMMDHLYTILQQFKNFQIDIWACGSRVYEDTLLKITNNNKRDLLKFNAKSDGGNDMRENFSFIKDHYKGREKIDLLIIMSDFYDPLDGDTNTYSTCPVIYMCIDHKDFVKPSKINGVVYPFEVDNENK